tara:strand:- start:200 stop:1171 length:972 start_codon:yes stop_codon:yes gene_type:complete
MTNNIINPILNNYLQKNKKLLTHFFYTATDLTTIINSTLLNNKLGVTFDSLLKKINIVNPSTLQQSKTYIDIQLPTNNLTNIHNCLNWLKPWRKGPFKLNELIIDTEWQSNLKWDRINKHINFENKTVLDVGTGNGYYLYKLVQAKAKTVIGLEPHPLYIMQFLLLNHLHPKSNIIMLPTGWQTCSQLKNKFNIILCMGVLYHQKNPINLLKTLKQTVTKNGTVILETLIIKQKNQSILLPQGRYCKMKNIYHLPSIDMLKYWCNISGFKQIDILNETQTTSTEQRSTNWSSQESLQNFLNPKNNQLTIEGYPAPVRVILKLQ